MTRTLRHRGPDDEGYLLLDTRTGCCEERRGPESIPNLEMKDIEEGDPNRFDLMLGFRRLSIIDLSRAGHQPMANAGRTLWIVYNGEIYNYVELRDELREKGHYFRTSTDTEVVLAAYEEWGETCLQRFNGMWAFAIWDVRERRLFCSRDRFGVKPFYYYWDGRTFAFASEIKAILASKALEPEPEDGVVYDFLAHGFLDHSAETFFDGIRRLKPGEWMAVAPGKEPLVSRYYTFPRPQPSSRSGGRSLADRSEELLGLLTDSVHLRLRSDVAVGSCLSGGLDSSTIVCLMDRLLGSGSAAARAGRFSGQQKTFTSAFEDPRCDERYFCEQVVKHTGVEPHYVFPSGQDLWRELDRLLWHQEEPFGSTSIYAQWNVMRLVREKGVTVVLDGQGSDELLAGYHPYYGSFLASLLRAGQAIGFLEELFACRDMLQLSWRQTTRRAAAAVLHCMPAAFRDALFAARNTSPPVRRYLRLGFLEGEAKRRTDLRRDGLAVVLGGDLAERLWYDLTTFSVPQLLRYEDKNSMAFSVEARVPFLDVRVAEFSATLPITMKIREGWTKFILRQATAGILPEEVRWRRDKKGFPTPECEWWRLHADQIRELFERPRSARFIDGQAVLRDLDTLMTDPWGGFLLWKLVCLEKWMRVWIPEGRS